LIALKRSVAEQNQVAVMNEGHGFSRATSDSLS
jgi:hypothetical protein